MYKQTKTNIPIYLDMCTYHTYVHVHTHTHVCIEKDLEGYSKVFAGPKGVESCVKIKGPTTVFLKLSSVFSYFIVNSYMLLLQFTCSLKSKLRPLMYNKDIKQESYVGVCLYVYLSACPAFA